MTEPVKEALLHLESYLTSRYPGFRELTPQIAYQAMALSTYKVWRAWAVLKGIV